MRKRERNNTVDQLLSRRLRDEALGSRPTFSADLHDRIMGSLAACPVTEPPRPRRTWSSPVVLATAAALLVAAGTARLWPTGQPATGDPVQPVAIADDVPETPPPSKAATPPEPQPHPQPTATEDLYAVAAGKMKTVKQVDVLVESMLINEQVALLDHDARMAADWVLDPLTLAFAE